MSNDKITEEKLKALLELACASPESRQSYHRFILSEINRLFGYTKMMIFPYSYRLFATGEQYKQYKQELDVFNNYITINMDHQSIMEYKANIQYVDIFAIKRLPPKLKGSKVILRRDLLSDSEYKDSEYGKAMAKIGVYDEACIYMYDVTNTKLLATIGIFQGEEEPAFTAGDKQVFEYLSDIISNQYRLIIQNSDEVVTRQVFDIFYQKSNVGAILVSHRLSVIHCNPIAYEICKCFREDFQSEKTQFYRSSLYYDKRFSDIQVVVDWIGAEIVNMPLVQYSSLRYEFIFSSFPYTITNIYGSVETSSLIQVIMKKVHLSDKGQEILEQLTLRESEILNYILKGYNNDQIANMVKISINTVKSHVSNIYHKFGVNNRMDLLILVKDNQQEI